jgi:gliding motility-associated-like protein
MGRNLLLSAFLALVGSGAAKAQCISVFPYAENFNGSTTQWFSGGINSDWHRVVAAKTYIASTTKCWLIANSTDTTYNTNQRSWVQSPCFDFSNVQYPYVQFDYNFECHSSQDGATFQYSLNNGATWTNVGSASDPADCLNDNWFSAAGIANLNTLATVKEGWSGTVRPVAGACTVGNGIVGWRVAKHSMQNLAGQSSVIFRFAFGSGGACNKFDGFAFDNVYIGEAPSNYAAFAKGCAIGQPLTYNFINTSSLCPTSFTWDFGDPASGAANTSTLVNPSHTYSAPGTYTVSFTVAGPANASNTTYQQVNTVDINALITPPSCAGDTNGKMQITAAFMYSPQFHQCSNGTSTNQGPYLFTGLPAGTYTVTSQGADNCMIVKSFTIVDPPVLDITNVNIVKPNCITNDGGEISVFGTGGTGAYSYSSGGNFGLTSTLQPLIAGTYTVTLKDAAGCTNSSVVTLEQEGAPLINAVDIAGIRCHNGDDGKLEVLASSVPSTITSFSISPNATQQSKGVFTSLTTGVYTIPGEIKLLSEKYLYLICKPELDTLTVAANGGIAPYEYILQPNYIKNTSGLFEKVPTGNYLVQAIDNNGCKAEIPIRIDEGDCCSDVYIPNAFTPNGDGMNDLFKMQIFGTVIINKFQIMNRLGETVFNNEVTQGWDGYHKGQESPMDTYYYVIMYTCRNGKSFTRQGEVAIIR